MLCSIVKHCYTGLMGSDLIWQLGCWLMGIAATLYILTWALVADLSILADRKHGNPLAEGSGECLVGWAFSDDSVGG